MDTLKIQCPDLKCSVTLETKFSNGTVGKRLVVKSAEIGLIRNEFRDMLLRVSFEQKIKKYQIDNFDLHKRFIKEGKATIYLKNDNLCLYISNAPPNQLLIFCKTLRAKSEKQKDVKLVSGRQRLLSTIEKVTNHISPLELSNSRHDNKENLTPVRPIKPGTVPKLADNNGRSIPGSRKRLADAEVSQIH